MAQKLPQIERFCDAPSVQLYRASVMLKEIRYCVTEKINQSWLDMASPPPVFLMTSVTMPLPAPDVPGAPWLPRDHWPLGTLCCCHLLRCICQHWADSSGASQGPDWLKIGSRSPDVRHCPVRSQTLTWLDHLQLWIVWRKDWDPTKTPALDIFNSNLIHVYYPLLWPRVQLAEVSHTAQMSFVWILELGFLNINSRWPSLVIGTQNFYTSLDEATNNKNTFSTC